MHSANCCRTCLSDQFLFPIFVIPEHCEKYTNTIFTTTGLRVERNDALPQKMCAGCINSINENFKFRKKCEETNSLLLELLENKQFDLRLANTNLSKLRNDESIAIKRAELIIDEDITDYEDNLTLASLQCTEKSDSPTHIEFETSVKDIDKPLDYLSNNKKNSKSKKVKLTKTKRENSKKVQKVEFKDKKEKTERIREEIRCEYCHKILTSKLSLRNHYKIHTGFDVVCEHCGKKFINRRLLLMHCRAKHGYEKTDKCSYCDYRASNAEQVKIHERLHTGEKPFVCAQCGAGFHRKSSYLQHVAIHLPDKTVQCDQCPARFKSVTLMRIHKNRHRAPQYTFKCLVCDNSFARRRNVARHLQRIHGLPPEQQHIDRLKIG